MPRKVTLAVLLVAAAVLGGCSPDAPDAPAGTPTGAGGSPTVSATVADDPPGMITCRRLATAVSGGTLMDAGVIDAILTAADTADAPVADAAVRLSEAYAAARTAAGTAAEPDAVAAVSAAAVDMSNVCADSGLASVAN